MVLFLGKKMPEWKPERLNVRIQEDMEEPLKTQIYKKLGYTVEFIREDKNPKLCKYFLSKHII